MQIKPSAFKKCGRQYLVRENSREKKVKWHTKVSDKGSILMIEQHIRRFHVTVDDAVGVQVRQAFAHVRQNRADACHCDRLALVTNKPSVRVKQKRHNHVSSLTWMCVHAWNCALRTYVKNRCVNVRNNITSNRTTTRPPFCGFLMRNSKNSSQDQLMNRKCELTSSHRQPWMVKSNNANCPWCKRQVTKPVRDAAIDLKEKKKEH